MRHVFLKAAVSAVVAAAMVSCSGHDGFDSSLLTLRIDADNVTSDVSPLFYGLMTEEINYSYDGGLYGELIRNRAFEAPAIYFRAPAPMPAARPRPQAQPQQQPQARAPQKDSQGLDPMPLQVAMRERAQQNPRPQSFGMPRMMTVQNPNDKYQKGLYYWNPVADGGASVRIAQDSIDQSSWTVLKHNARIEISGASEGRRAGIYNEGYWGVPVLSNTTYKASFWAKAAPGFDGTVTLTIESNDASDTFASAQSSKLTTDWQKYELELTVDGVEPKSDARFTLTSTSNGKFWISLVSLFPPTYNGRENGNRQDLMQLMAEMHPRFLRFPGGNYLQGHDEATRFDWKNMIGPIEQRPTHYNRAWQYHSSDGMGLLEFMYWCEDLGMEPVLGIFAGLYLGTAAPSPFLGEDLEPFIDDALDEIEYLTGGTDTEWGALRASHGHPEPFALKYVEIGNEDFLERGEGTYSARYKQIYDRIKAVHPELTLIASSRMVDSMTPDMVDVHQYMRVAQGALGEAHRYDDFDRSAPIIIGEYATREGSPTTNLEGGLYDAAYLTGLERNADIIRMTCFAPIFVNVNDGAMQWASDLMGYDAVRCYGSPSYYVQSMFSANLGDSLVAMSMDNVPVDDQTGFEDVYCSVTKDSDYIYLKAVNVSDTAYPFQTAISGVRKVMPEATVTVLSGSSLTDTNTIDSPRRIAPEESVQGGIGKRFSTVLPPYSVSVYRIAYR